MAQYRLMQAWKAHEHIDFDFVDCQAQFGLRSEDEDYIKRIFRERINLSGTYVMLIGADTRFKHKYVLWEAQIALEKKCRIIGVNLDGWRHVNLATCPSVMNNIGALFVPFSPQIVAYALQNATRQESGNWEYNDQIYTQLGYVVVGERAERPAKTNPYSRHL